MLSELLNAMMMAELLFDRTVVLLGSRSQVPGSRIQNQMTPIRILHVDDEPDIREVVDPRAGSGTGFRDAELWLRQGSARPCRRLEAGLASARLDDASDGRAGSPWPDSGPT